MLVGVKCDIRRENVKFAECLICNRCNYPLILKKKTFSQKNNNSKVSVTRIVDCLRKSYLQMKNEYYMEKKGLISVGLGTLIHKQLQDSFDISEKYVDYTTPKDNKLIGYIDGIEIHSKTIVDLKTTSFGKYKLNSDFETSDRDAMQLQMYWNMLKKQGVNIEKAKVIYIGLGDKICHERTVPFIDRTEFMDQRTDELTIALEEDKLPKAEPQWIEYECDYCPFKEECHRLDNKSGGFSLASITPLSGVQSNESHNHSDREST